LRYHVTRALHLLGALVVIFGMDRGNDAVRKRTKRQVCDAYLNKMLARPDISHLEAGFTDRLKRHFDLLPTRYALDINLETLDVLNHMQLLEEARSDPSAVFFHVRIVEVMLHSNAHSPNDDAEAIAANSDMETDQVRARPAHLHRVSATAGAALRRRHARPAQL
jgi:hypothetical protein